MSQKITRIIICTLVIMCVFCSSFTVFAENDTTDVTVDSSIIIQPELPEEDEEETPEDNKDDKPANDKEDDKPSGNDKDDKPVSGKPANKPGDDSAEKPQQTPNETPQERPQNNNQNQNNNTNTDGNKVPETDAEEATTEAPLPEGSFYVYMEKNNGERREKTVLDGPGVLPKPIEPKRVGYIFDGWYSDSKFKKEWSFLKDVATGEMTIYAKWIPDESTVVFDIIIEDMVGGTIEANPGKASKGEPVFITVTPDEGKRLVPGSLLINGKSTDIFSFLMPKGKVYISATFEDIPETDKVVKEEKDFTPFIILGVVLLVAIIAFVIVIIKRRSDLNADLDPDEEEVDTQEEEIVWIDESITVEDGFKGGKKIVENVEPDYGAPEADEDYFE